MTARSRMLRDPDLDQALWQEGYVVVPFLDAAGVDRLRRFFQELHPEPLEGMYASVHRPDREFRLRISDVLKETFRPSVERTFRPSTSLGGALLAKAGGERAVLQPHQDWNIVLEDRFRSFNIWVPLVDTDAHNGAIQVIPRSHHWLDTVRGPNIPSTFEKVNRECWDSMQLLPIPAGHALIYDHGLLHASGVNHSDELRTAAVFAIIPEEAELKYYYLHEGRIERFAADSEFYLTASTQKGPAGLASEGFEDYDFPLVDAELFAKLLGRHAA